MFGIEDNFGRIGQHEHKHEHKHKHKHKHGPSLVDPSTQFFFKHILQQCKRKKFLLYNTIFNSVGFFIFFILVIYVLWECRKKKHVWSSNIDKRNQYTLETLKRMKEFDEIRHHELASNLTTMDETNRYYQNKHFI